MTLTLLLDDSVSGPAPPAPAPIVAPAPDGGEDAVTIRLQALDGTWETCGADRAIGVLPETLTASANEWGPDKASFDLRRSVIALWPDLGAFTPVEIEVGGVLVWEGRTGETPIRPGAAQVINVQCEGWQYHLDDDVYQRVYVHSKLTDWKDSRSFLEAPLAVYLQSGKVQSSQGRVTIGYAKEDQVAAFQCVGVTLDLGPVGPGAVYIAIDTQLLGGVPPNTFLYILGHNGFTSAPEAWLERQDAVSGAVPTTGTYAGAISGRRYVSILLAQNGTPETRAEDLSLILTGIRVFTDVAFESAFQSVLHASTIVADALSRSTMLLSKDFSQIAATSFPIPDFALSKLSTPRQVIEAANAYHNWITKLLPGRRFQFKARPSEPLLEVGAWHGSDTEDQSANSGAEIFSGAVIEANGPDGSPLVVARSAGQQPGAEFSAISSPAPENPSFAFPTVEPWKATTTEFWSPALTRDTTTFASFPASARWTLEAGGTVVTTAKFSGVFSHGITYRLSFAMKRAGVLQSVEARLGTGTDFASESLSLGTAFASYTIAWTPLEDSTGVTLTIISRAAPNEAAKAWIDSLVLQNARPTLVDRRGFRRTKVIGMSSPITAAEGQQLGDVFLEGHMTTPFKGQISVYPGGARTVLGGQPVHPALLLLQTQELLRCSHLIDPDTGGVGRDGTIAEVIYTHKEKKATVTLDDKRGNFDALLARLEVVQSVGS